MSTSRSEPSPLTTRLGLAGVALSLVAALAGCRDGAPDAEAASPIPVTTPAPAVVDPLIGEVTQAPDVIQALTRSLANRAQAITAGDLGGYRSGLEPRNADFLAQQEQYFTNLRQLPLQALSFTPDPATLVRKDKTYAVNVAVTMQLAGYDAVPVTTIDRYRFAPVKNGRRFRLASVTDAAWEARNQVQSQPWDTGEIQVRTGAGVLGIFDPQSLAGAGPLLRSVQDGITAVAALVPYEWARTVVVYALSDDAFLSAIPDLPSGDPDELDAVAFPVFAQPALVDQEAGATASPTPAPATLPAMAGTRLVFHPRMLDRAGPSRDRLVRHELTHAAVGPHDDHAPVWLSEGLAEYVSVQAEAPEARSIANGALTAARAGFSDLPADDGFNDDDSAAHYGLAWWACEYIALGVGTPTLWTLLDQLEALGVSGTLDRAAEDTVLTTLTGVNARTLARKAGKLLLTTFEPPPPPTPTPVPLPSGYPTGPVAPATPGTTGPIVASPPS